MSALLRRLERAGKRGAALLALSAAAGCTPIARDVDGGSLGPAPALTCHDANWPQYYYSDCCGHLHCYPSSGAPCVDPSGALPTLDPPRWSHGGGCDCGRAGPFAAPDGAVDQCCYVLATVACLGRPLVVDGSAVVAPLARRSDWA